MLVPPSSCFLPDKTPRGKFAKQKLVSARLAVWNLTPCLPLHGLLQLRWAPNTSTMQTPLALY